MTLHFRDRQLQHNLKTSGHEFSKVKGGKNNYATAFSVRLSLVLKEMPVICQYIN